MDDLHIELERERKKLNELGQSLVDQSIPLACNKELLLQSRRVDELLNQLYRRKSIGNKT